MRIPNSNQAIIDIRKLRDYCLNSDHDEGKHKARLFAAALDMTAAHADGLRNFLFQAVKQNDNARLGRRDELGQRYLIDFTIE